MRKSGGMMRYFAGACTVFLLAALTACKSSQAPSGYPKVLHYAHSPEQEQMQGSSVRTELMRSYLEAQLHIPVQMVTVVGYAPTIEAMHTGKVDMATFGPLGYIIASKKANAQAIVARGASDGSLGSYKSVIVVPKNSPIHSIADLKAHAKDVDFMFTDPASTSGNLIPRAYLQSIGIDPEKDFKKTVFANSHIVGALTVKSGKVDAGAISQSVMARLNDLGKLAPDDIRVIWASDPIPSSPYSVRGDLPDALKKQIQQALLNIPTKDPALWESLQKSYHETGGSSLIPVTDATYDGLRKFASQVKDFNLVEK